MENSSDTKEPIVLETTSEPAPDSDQGTQISLTITGSSNAAANAGGIIGIVGAVLSLIPVAGIFIGIPAGILAVIFSGIGMARAKAQSGSSGMGMAVTGLVLGILTIIFKLIPG
ncbi:MAG: hypothetical protein C7B46_20015, partial [Sulfobacillus benefaciens]